MLYDSIDPSLYSTAAARKNTLFPQKKCSGMAI